ncbi:MAG: ferritin-like domain-containing protein [Dehalococcoidales bacterium]|nr:ferritin-like domain-containing protein [Dehalococcoidales bacterium]
MSEKREPVVKASAQLLDLLNDAISRELQVSIQYMWQHVQWSGVKGFAVQDELEKIAITEMKHAESIAERLFYLGGTPTTTPAPIHVGASLKEMLEQDIKDEESGINLYRQILNKAREENDDTTHRLFRNILEAEEDHHDTFTTLLEDL